MFGLQGFCGCVMKGYYWTNHVTDIDVWSEWPMSRPWEMTNFGRRLFAHLSLSCKYSIYCWRDKDLLHNERPLQRQCDGGGLWLFDENSLYKNCNNIYSMTNADQKPKQDNEGREQQHFSKPNFLWKAYNVFISFWKRKKKTHPKYLRKKWDNIVEVYFLYYLTKLHFNF